MRSLMAARRLAPMLAGRLFPPARPLWVAILLAATMGALGCGESPSAPGSAEDVAQDETAVGAAAVVASGYVVVDLGAFPGAGTGSVAYAINRSRQVVGVAERFRRRVAWKTMRFSGRLGSCVTGTSVASQSPVVSSQALGINDAGKVVGLANRPDGQVHAFLWTNGTMRDLGTLGGMQSGASASMRRDRWSGTARSRPPPAPSR